MQHVCELGEMWQLGVTLMLRSCWCVHVYCWPLRSCCAIECCAVPRQSSVLIWSWKVVLLKDSWVHGAAPCDSMPLVAWCRGARGTGRHCKHYRHAAAGVAKQPVTNNSGAAARRYKTVKTVMQTVSTQCSPGLSLAVAAGRLSEVPACSH
jgi:hypothetical protein